MKRITLTLLAVALLLIVIALLLTSVGAHPLSGNMLMTHMFASGAMVIVLPLFAVTWLWRIYDAAQRGTLMRVGYWSLLLTGFVATGTMFLSMLPIAGTQWLTRLIVIHGYAGFAMVAAALLFTIGWLMTKKTSAS